MKKQATQGGRFIVKRQCTEWGGRHCFAGAGQHPPPAEPVPLAQCRKMRPSAARCHPISVGPGGSDRHRRRAGAAPRTRPLFPRRHAAGFLPRHLGLEDWHRYTSVGTMSWPGDGRRYLSGSFHRSLSSINFPCQRTGPDLPTLRFPQSAHGYPPLPQAPHPAPAPLRQHVVVVRPVKGRRHWTYLDHWTGDR